MMFGSFMLKKNDTVRILAMTGILLVLAANILEMNGIVFFKVNTIGMLEFSRYSLLFISIMLTSIFLYFLLSNKT